MGGIPEKKTPPKRGLLLRHLHKCSAQLQRAADVLESSNRDDYAQYQTGNCDAISLGSFKRSRNLSIKRSECRTGSHEGNRTQTNLLNHLHNVTSYHRSFFRTRKPKTMANNSITSPCSSDTCSQFKAAPDRSRISSPDTAC